MAAISPSFESKKQKILKDLSVPDEKYTDLSPKGSVDEGIRDLIHDINGLPGLVTTSSCAGRISIYLEGNKAAVSVKDDTGHDMNAGEDETLNDSTFVGVQKRFAATGGKGGGGKWLFVTHDPVVESDRPFHELFGIVPGDGIPRMDQTEGVQLVRFHFEPMVSCPVEKKKHISPIK